MDISPRKKLKSPAIDITANINIKTSVTCTNVPESLFEAAAAKRHFSKFGRVQKIKLFPKKHMCVIEYDQPMSAERAVLNAGAFDGFMFDVTRTKPRVRRRSKRDDDPDWLPDSEVEEELSAMSGAPTYRAPRQKPMEIATPNANTVNLKRVMKQSIKTKTPVKEKIPVLSTQPVDTESPAIVATSHTSMSTTEAAAELHQLRSRVSLTPDEQWRTLDARDRILRAWGGAGSRVKVGGATIGTCPDMCPEKELLHRQAEHQVMTLETVPESDGQLSPARAVKQYSRSSADQEIPMCYELRPPATLVRTCSYLLHEIADTKRQVMLADWFHFMWDRLRGIRKDITQQALCCADSISMVEMCARFHAHCAARLADLEHTQFDQKLNTDNLTKCLQTLKHMYGDVGQEKKPNEAEFRGYIALLNLGDANFWWEIKQLPPEIQKSEAIIFAIKIFNAIDNNNYVRFFRLVKHNATYIQACILLRYFNDVRARALARIVKAYAPRGGSRYPAHELMESLAFESVESMTNFVRHYGLRFGKDEHELCVILDRNQFMEDMDPFPVARAVNLIEAKRHCSVGEVIAGNRLPHYNPDSYTPYSSFTPDGKLKVVALTAEDHGYSTINDSNKDVRGLRTEILRLSQGGRTYSSIDKTPEQKVNLFAKPMPKSSSPVKTIKTFLSPQNMVTDKKSFLFTPAIQVASTDIIKNSPEKIFGDNTKNIFSFSKPQDSGSLSSQKVPVNLFKLPNSMETKAISGDTKLFGVISHEKNTNTNVFSKPTVDSANTFSKPVSVFGKTVFNNNNVVDQNNSLFKNVPSTNPFSQTAEQVPLNHNKNIFGAKNVFAKEESSTSIQNTFAPENNIFAKAKQEMQNANPTKVGMTTNENIFAKAVASEDTNTKPTNVFAAFKQPSGLQSNNIFTKTENGEVASNPTNLFMPNGGATLHNLSPGTLFKSANADGKQYNIFQSKNKSPSVADNIFNSVNVAKPSVYDFDQGDGEPPDIQRLNEEKMEEERERERKLQERERELKEQEEKLKELKRKEEERKLEEKRKEDEKRKQEELRRIEEKRKKEEERKQEELRKKLEAERLAEIKRKAEEKEKVEKESVELVEELLNEVREESLREILTEELEYMKQLVSYANVITGEIWTELSDEISEAEMKAEKFWTDKLMKKWFWIWKKQSARNFNRRTLLEDTPVWITNKSPEKEATLLKRQVENSALRHMNAIHRGYKFTGELHQLPPPDPYNIMEIIKSPFLKRMKQIKYPYDKCFFWKVTILTPGKSKWICKKIELNKWICDAFSDKKEHDTSNTLIHVQKQSWNNLMDFAISVSMTSDNNHCLEAVEGTNGLLFYFTENDRNIAEIIESSLKHRYLLQVLPVAVILPEAENIFFLNTVKDILATFVRHEKISDFKVFVVDSQNIAQSMHVSTKSALKWLAKNFPQTPPLEIDNLKSLCQRYLGNEIWYRLKSDRNCLRNNISKDLIMLVNSYNAAVERLTNIITDEKLFNYPSFPLEFNQYLDHTSPYPKPYEFIPTNVRNSNNTSAIIHIMKELKLPYPTRRFNPVNVITMQDQIRTYCNQIEWFEDPEDVVCKVVSLLPNQLSDFEMPHEEFKMYFEQYDLLDFLNVIVCEKINRLGNIDSYFAVYEKTLLAKYRNIHWLYETEVISSIKHKVLDYKDNLDVLIDAKRRKLAENSMEYLMLQDSDCTMVEDNIKATTESISQYSSCKKAVKQLEYQIDEERKKSVELEKLLKLALSNV